MKSGTVQKARLFEQAGLHPFGVRQFSGVTGLHRHQGDDRRSPGRVGMRVDLGPSSIQSLSASGSESRTILTPFNR